MRCPICKVPVVRPGNDHYPFCSEHCRLVDLSKWLDEEYRIPGAEAESAPPESDEGDPPPVH